MSKIQASTDVASLKPEEVQKFLDLFLQETVRVVNGGLGLENFDGKVLSITFGVANVDTTLAHNLGRVPSGYIVTGASAACSVYNGSAANTSANIILRSDAPATVGLWVY